jgi:hypothetical protein
VSITKPTPPRPGKTEKDEPVNTLRTRIARLTAASVLTLGLGALASAPAFADPSVGRGEPVGVTLAADDDASTDGIGKPSGRS